MEIKTKFDVGDIVRQSLYEDSNEDIFEIIEISIDEGGLYYLLKNITYDIENTTHYLETDLIFIEHGNK